MLEIRTKSGYIPSLRDTCITSFVIQATVAMKNSSIGNNSLKNTFKVFAAYSISSRRRQLTVPLEPEKVKASHNVPTVDADDGEQGGEVLFR